MKKTAILLASLSLLALQQIAFASVLDPNCTPEKGVKSAVAKSTIGIGGRCTPSETAKDTAKRSVGIDQKEPLKKHQGKKEEKSMRNAAKKVAQ